MLAHMTLGTFIVLVVAGITYGIILAIRDLLPHATPVVPNIHNGSLDNVTSNQFSAKFLTVLDNRSNNADAGEDMRRYFYNHTLSASAFPTPKQNTPPQCIDPTFACQDLQSARLCGVASECIHDIWSNMGAPDDNDQICDICKEMVKEARDQLLSNMTQEEIKEVFEGSCKLLPIKLVADACIKVVDEIIPQLVEMLASRMDPNMVCTVSGLCNVVPSSETLISKFVKMILVYRNDDECAECTTMMTDVKTFLKTASESEVKQYIENFCDEKIPSYLCDMLVDSYFPSLYSYVINTDSRAMCSSVGVCPKICDPKGVTPFNDELTCEFCEHVLQHIKDLVTANTTAEEFRTALLNFCKHMGSYSDKCTSIVNDYYDMLFDYIKKLDTKGMCTLIGLCNNEKCSQMPLIKLIPALETRKRVPMIKLEPAVAISKNLYHPLIKLIPSSVANKKEMVESNDIFPSSLPLEKFIHPLAIFQKDTECAFCKAISFYLEQDLKQDRSKDSVQRALDNVCTRWVKDFPEECTNFLNSYSIKIQHAVAQGIELEDICAFTKICELENGKSELKVKVIPNLKDGPFCDLCKDAMTEIENQLSDPATKQKIEDLMDQGCSILPKSLKDDCVNFLNSNIDALFDILQQELQPDNICPALRLCDGKAIGVTQRVKDLECDVCKDVVSSLREKMSNPDSKKIVLTFLEEGCARLPGSLAEECKTFIDENIDVVISMIVQELDPDTVCSILKICNATVVVEKPKKVKDIECDLCKEVVQKVEDLVKDKKTEEEIKSALEKVCAYLPSSLSAKCKNFVDQYTETLITLLMEEMDPDMICAALNVCPANVQFPAWQSKAQDLECQGCQYALHFVQDQLNNPETQGEVKNLLKRMCDVLPSTYAKNCEAFVNEYGSSLLVLIAQEIDPSVLCFELKLCTDQPKIFEKPVDILHPFKTDECSVCTTVVDYLDKLLEEDDVDKEITKLVEKVCTVLPSSFANSCSAMLETYGPYILQMIGQLADSKQVCQEIDLCPTPAGHVHLLGGNKCTFGPSYWCKSSAHASACKAEMFCKEKFWKN